MGLYNIVKVPLDKKIDCPICGKAMEQESREGEWQTKFLHDVDELTMTEYPLEAISGGEMHGMCEHCESFVELEIKNGEIIGGGKR